MRPKTKTDECLLKIAIEGCRRRGLDAEGIEAINYQHLHPGIGPLLLIVFHCDAPQGGAIYLDGNGEWTAEAQIAEFRAAAEVIAELTKSGDLNAGDFE